jgi:hypothetical protein
MKSNYNKRLITVTVIAISGFHCTIKYRKKFKFKFNNPFVALIIQWKPLNVITLGQIETDNINQMIKIT